MTGPTPGALRPLLVRQSAIGDFVAPAPRPTLGHDPLMRWGRWGLLPISSVMRVQTDDRVAALTYDDGPEPAETTALLDVLAERGVAATFFVLSDRAQAHPDLIGRMVREGHEVALHGIDHASLTQVSGREAVRRIRVAKQRIEAVSGRRIQYYRPTYGAIGMTALAGARLLGMDVVIWSAWAEDWFDDPAQQVADRAVGALHPGAIVLLHDVTDQPESDGSRPRPTFSRADVARRILDGVDASGYRILRIGELLHRYPPVRSVTVQRPRLPFR
jgi:peptidoglycan/xylan/chitin deacetylase (PgdA/CDA1 family)